jgi:high-affinity nickel-transport protein
MPVLDLLASSSVGSLFGMRHAFEPDHLAAVSTLTSHERSGWRAAWLGACWGLGHTLSLVIVGGALLALRTEMPERLAIGFELIVAVMLVALGTRAIVYAVRADLGVPVTHHHGPQAHTHAGLVAHVHVGAWTFARRPLLIGAIHGLAGSGALTALVLTTLPSTAARLAYMALFGIGSTLGMAMLTGMLGVQLARLSARHTLSRRISLLVGSTSALLGIAWGYPLISQLL